MAKGYLIDAELLAAIREVVHEMRGQLKNPGGTIKRGNVSIGLSSYVAKIKTTVTARSGETLGTGEVYLCEADSEGMANPTTKTKTVYNTQAKEITLTTESDTFIDIQQTNWGIYTVRHPSNGGCNYLDGQASSDISGYSTAGTQFLTHGTTGCFSWVTGSTCT